MDYTEKYLLAKSYQSKRHTCIGFAFFYGGIDPTERFRSPGHIEKYSDRLVRVNNSEEAFMVGYECRIKKGFIHHLWVPHPLDSSKFIGRGDSGGLSDRSIELVMDFLLHSNEVKPAFYKVR